MLRYIYVLQDEIVDGWHELIRRLNFIHRFWIKQENDVILHCASK